MSPLFIYAVPAIAIAASLTAYFVLKEMGKRIDGPNNSIAAE